MKRSLAILIVPILMICLVVSCNQEAIIHTDTAETISIKVNHEFIIATPSNPATGYMWRETYDESMLELVVSTFEVSEAVKKGEAEVGLEQHLRFKALKKGKTEVLIDLLGPDLKHSKGQKRFNVAID